MIITQIDNFLFLAVHDSFHSLEYMNKKYEKYFGASSHCIPFVIKYLNPKSNLIYFIYDVIIPREMLFMSKIDKKM